MVLSATLVAAAVGAIIESATLPTVRDPVRYAGYVDARTIPPDAHFGWMHPPPGNGTVLINNELFPLSPASQFRNHNNLIVMPMTIIHPTYIVYTFNMYGSVHRVWLITEKEANAIKERRRQKEDKFFAPH